MTKKLLVFILAFAAVYAFGGTSTPLAYADDAKSDIVVKDARNHEYCRLSVTKTTCDLSAAKFNSTDSEEANLDTSDNESGAQTKITGTITLEDTSNYSISLNKVNAPGLILSADDPITIKSKNAGEQQVFGSIIQTESTASTIFEEGDFTFNNSNGIAVKTAGRLALRRGAHINATGKTNAIYASGQLLTDEEAYIDAKVEDNGSPTSVIVAGSIETNSGTSINVARSTSPAQTDDTDSEDGDTAAQAPEQTLPLTGISTLSGGMITLKRTNLNITNVTTGISTYTSGVSSLTANKAGDIFIQGGTTKITDNEVHGIQANSVSITDNADVQINQAASYLVNDAIKSVAIGAIYDVNIKSSKVVISSTYGIITNGSLKVTDDSELEVKALMLGISTYDVLEVSGATSVNINPISPVDAEAFREKIASIPVFANGFIAAYFGSNANFSLIDNDNVSFTANGKVLAGAGSANLTYSVYEYHDIIASAGVNAGIADGEDPYSKFYLKLNTNTSNIEAAEYTTVTTPPTIDISDTTQFSDGEQITFKPVAEASTLYIAYDGSNIATKVTILPKPINILVKLFYQHTLIFCIVVLLILLLIILIVSMVIYKQTHKRALFLMYLQNDMMENGPLGIKGANEVAENIERYISKYHKKFKQIYLIRGWHKPDNDLFEKWPKHNVQNTPGADFVGNLRTLAKDYQMEVVSAGIDDNGYNVIDERMKNALADNKINYIYFAGNTLDYSILKSSIVASDLVKKNHVIVLRNLTTAMSGDVTKVKQKLSEKHIRIL